MEGAITMAVNYAKNRQTLRKAHNLHHDKGHAAFREVKTKSYYPFGRKKGAGLTRSEQFCANYDAIFGKKPAPEGKGSADACADCGKPIEHGADVTFEANDTITVRHGKPSCKSAAAKAR